MSEDNKPNNKRRKVIRFLSKVLAVIVLQLILIPFFSMIFIYHSPFHKFRDSIVVQAMNTHQQHYWATWFLPKSTIDQVMEKANPVMANEVQDISSIQISKNIPEPTPPVPSKTPVKTSVTYAPATVPSKTPDNTSVTCAPTAVPSEILDNTSVTQEPTAKPSKKRGKSNVTTVPTVAPVGKDLDSGATIVDISTKSYHGKLMIISEPSRVCIGMTQDPKKRRVRLATIVSSYNACGGVNAGGFLDDNFIETGSTPAGIVIIDGKIVAQQEDLKEFNVIGFNQDNVLVINNKMTIDEINNANLRCAVSFGPALILNGISLVVSGGNSLQPRTIIGQRKDGTVLLMTIDGRQAGSSGANFSMVVEEMLKYGAYNAANLDGGSSTVMCWGGKVLNSPCSDKNGRAIATAILVMPKN